MRLITLLVPTCLTGTLAVAQPVLFVDDDAPPLGDGLSWETAFDDLQDALAAAGGDPSVDQIWVAAGTYRPDKETGNPNLTFDLFSGIEIYGGFDGTEGALEDRAGLFDATILTGDIAGPSSYHVVRAQNVFNTRLDGFVIRDGNAAGSVVQPDIGNGGGIKIYKGNPVFANCRVENNVANLNGGGVYYELSNASFESCVFANNSVFSGEIGLGGAIAVVGSAPTITDCEFSGNLAVQGGAMAISSGGATITGTTFVGNSATLFGTIAAVGGLPDINGFPNELTLIGCEFVQNSDLSGSTGGMDVINSVLLVQGCVFEAQDGRAANIANSTEGAFEGCTFEANVAQTAGGAIKSLGDIDVVDCVFVSNRAEGLGTGGAISNSGTMAIRGGLFVENESSFGGGAIYATQGSTVVAESVFVRNQSESSGGAIYSGNVSVVSCRFHDNAGSFGGGIAVAGPTSVHNSVFTSNSTGGSPGGGLAVLVGTEVQVSSSTFVRNQPDIDGAGLWANDLATASIANSVLWENGIGLPNREAAQVAGFDTVDYCVVEGLASLPGVGNIGSNPLLVDVAGEDGIVGTIDDDVSLGEGSPAADAGDNDRLPPDVADLDGDGDLFEALPLDVAGLARRSDDPDVADTGDGAAPIVDMGAHERQGASCYADFNGDGSLDILDFVSFQGAFQAGDGSADANGDGVLNVLDFVAFQGAFVAGCP